MVGSQPGCSSGELGTLRSSLSSGKQPVGWVGFRDKSWSSKTAPWRKGAEGPGRGIQTFAPPTDTPTHRPAPPTRSLPTVMPERPLVAGGALCCGRRRKRLRVLATRLWRRRCGRSSRRWPRFSAGLVSGRC